MTSSHRSVCKSITYPPSAEPAERTLSHRSVAHHYLTTLCHHLARRLSNCDWGGQSSSASSCNSVPMSILVKPTTSISTISFAAACRLQLIPLFHRFGFYSCDTSLFVPTGTIFYTSKVSLQCSHPDGRALCVPLSTTSPLVVSMYLLLYFQWSRVPYTR